jgi:hypothetical protein
MKFNLNERIIETLQNVLPKYLGSSKRKIVLNDILRLPKTKMIDCVIKKSICLDFDIPNFGYTHTYSYVILQNYKDKSSSEVTITIHVVNNDNDTILCLTGINAVHNRSDNTRISMRNQRDFGDSLMNIIKSKKEDDLDSSIKEFVDRIVNLM